MLSEMLGRVVPSLGAELSAEAGFEGLRGVAVTDCRLKLIPQLATLPMSPNNGLRSYSSRSIVSKVILL